MIYLRKLLTLIIVVVAFVSLTAAVALAQDPANGKAIWEEQSSCRRCHGLNGEGVFGAPLAGTDKTAQEFITQVRTPRNRMPSYAAGQISDEMLTDIQAYMASIPEPTEFGFKQIELDASAPEGQTLMVEKRCVGCHTEAVGEAGFLTNNLVESGSNLTAERVTQQLRTPFQWMPAFNADQVSDAEATLIADYLIGQISGATPPPALPTSGSDAASRLPLYISILGGGLLLIGLAMRKFVTRSS